MESVTCSVVSDSLRPMECSPPVCFVHGNSQAGILKYSPGDPPDPGIEPRFPAFQADSLPFSKAPPHVNPWLIPINVWQKPLQYCKVISLQLI